MHLNILCMYIYTVKSLYNDSVGIKKKYCCNERYKYKLKTDNINNVFNLHHILI